MASSVRRGDPSATLNPTALVNEAWIKLAKSPEITTTSQLHFKRIAARAMRQVVIEAAPFLIVDETRPERMLDAGQPSPRCFAAVNISYFTSVARRALLIFNTIPAFLSATSLT